jgi:hypothetical protein
MNLELVLRSWFDERTGIVNKHTSVQTLMTPPSQIKMTNLNK